MFWFCARKVALFHWMILLASVAYALLMHPTYAQIPPDARFDIKLSTLRCYNADEDGFLSDGDEPYVIVAEIVPDPFAGYVLHFAKTPVYNEVDRSDKRELNLGLLIKHVDSEIAIITQVVEEDNTGRDIVYAAAQSAGNDTFVEEMKLGAHDLHWIAEEVRHAMRIAMADELKIPDPDDLVGPTSLIFITSNELAKLPIATTMSKVITARSLGISYTLTITVRRA